MATYSAWLMAQVALALLVIHRIGLIVYRVYFHPLAKIPGPKLFAASKLPILYLNNIEGTWVRDAVCFHAKYGPIVRTGPDLLSVDGSVGFPEIFNHKKPEFTKHALQFDDYYRGSLITADTTEHRRLRRIFAPAFTEKAVRAQEPILQRATTCLTQQLKKRQGQDIEFNKWINYTTFDINGELNLGESFHGVEQDELHFWVKLIFESIRAVSISRLFREYRWLRMLKPLIITKKLIDKKETHENIVRERISKRIQAGADAKQDLMTYFMEHMEKGALSEHRVRVDAGIFIVAGAGTSATSSSALLYHLCKEPESYERLTSEIRGTFANEDEITIAATTKLVYLDLCLREAMRLHSPAPELVPRQSPGATIGGYWVPEGTELSVPVNATFTNPQHFHLPNSFRPQRHAQKGSSYYDPAFASDNLSVFEPFSVGARDCIGRHLGWAQMRLIIAKILWTFDVEMNWNVSDGWLDRQRVWLIWDNSEQVGGLIGRVRER